MRLLFHDYCEYVFHRNHYSDVIMSAMASQITGAYNVCSIVGSGADHRKHQNSASLAFVWGVHRSPVNSPNKGPVTRKMFPFDDVIIWQSLVGKVLLDLCKLIQHSGYKVLPNTYCFGSKTPVLYETYAHMFSDLTFLFFSIYFRSKLRQIF